MHVSHCRRRVLSSGGRDGHRHRPAALRPSTSWYAVRTPMLQSRAGRFCATYIISRYSGVAAWMSWGVSLRIASVLVGMRACPARMCKLRCPARMCKLLQDGKEGVYAGIVHPSKRACRGCSAGGRRVCSVSRARRPRPGLSSALWAGVQAWTCPVQGSVLTACMCCRELAITRHVVIIVEFKRRVTSARAAHAQLTCMHCNRTAAIAAHRVELCPAP